ncbi:MAG: AlpA family transcriptional regulator [Gammaproteobacteria bacterium]|nr:AlpA family transcriptional regulator [Gammaproteobacteria bacterium]
MAACIQRLPTVTSRTGLSRTTLYDKIAKGDFPPPIRLGMRAVGWLEEDITKWIEARIATSRADRK